MPVAGRAHKEQGSEHKKPAPSSLRIASAAHELKNPLQTIADLVYLLQQNPHMEGQAHEHLNQIEKELEHVRHIINQTLGRYREPASPTIVALSDMLDTILRLHDHKIVFKQVKVDKRYECSGLVKALSEDMRQVFGNLVVNALEALRLNGKLTVHLFNSREWSTAGRTGVRVVIGDNGSGILAEQRGRIFQPTFTTKGEKGTGLGLWVSAGIVHRQGGSIRFRSSTQPGRNGTVFSVFLPAPHLKLESTA